jgi:flagellar biosynthetic protein FliQ
VTDAQVLQIAGGALAVAAKLAVPLLGVSLVIGVAISLLQTITQIQEQSLTFVPKLIGVGVLVLLLGSWMIRELTTWVTALWRAIPTML